MEIALWIFGGLIVLFIIISLVWREQSKQRAIPCPSWLSWMLEPENPFSPANHARNIIQWLDIQPGMKVLDAGCGPGRLTLPMAEKTGPKGSVLALDVQEGMLQRVQNKTQNAGLDNITFLQAGLGQGKLPAGQFDRAILVTVLGEIPDQAAALQELFGTLKSGGILSITESIFDPHFQQREKVLALGTAAGFVEGAFFGKPLAYSLHLKKPV